MKVWMRLPRHYVRCGLRDVFDSSELEALAGDVRRIQGLIRMVRELRFRHRRTRHRISRHRRTRTRQEPTLREALAAD